MKKQRKLQPKIERLFKSIELQYSKQDFYTGYDLRQSNILNNNLILNFKYKYNVNVIIGIGCLVIYDNLSEFKYLIGYYKNRRFIECKKK